jgi:hypothetical protein
MTSPIQDLRRKIIDIVTTQLPELHGYPKVVPNVTVPAVMCFPPDMVNPNETMDGGASTTLPIRLYVDRQQDGTEQDALDAYISPSGPKSIFAIFDANPTLDHTVADCRAMGASGYGNWPVGSITYIGVEIQLNIMLE